MVSAVTTPLDQGPGAAKSRARTGGTSPLLAVLRSPVTSVVRRRLVTSVVLLFVVSVLSFVLVTLTPGDAAHAILGAYPPPGAYAKLRHEFGLDHPLYVQYWNWLRLALHGNLGSSIFNSQSVTQAINGRIAVTATLIVGSLLVSVTAGVAIGVFSAVRGGIAGRAMDGFALIGYALPDFWVGTALIAIVAVKLRLLPATGYVSFAQSPIDWLRSLILPVMALSVGVIAAIAKQTRDAMLDALHSEYIRVAWANGLSPRSIFFKHALKNASMRVLTVIGLYAVGLLGGTVVIENVFGLPGLGSLAVQATSQHDLPVVQGIVIYFTIAVVAINLVIDIAYTWLDPRVRTR